MHRTIEDDLERIKARLSTYYNAAEVEEWLNAPHPQLEGRTALALIEDGKAAVVCRVIDSLDSDAYL